jgi:NADPH2:quinone reductase
MKAIRVQNFGSPETLGLVELPDLIPSAGQILVRLQAVGVNPVETYIRAGQYGKLPSLPYIPGSDGAGAIAGLGAGVAGWNVGERVYIAGCLTGAYAQETLCEPGQVHHLPPAITFPQGAALGIPYGTAHVALFHRGQAAAGETILIHGGTGGVGLAAVQLALVAGLRVLATGGSEEGRSVLHHQGVHTVFDHHDPKCPERIMEATGGHGVDLILEMLANVNLGKDLPMLAPSGRVIVVGSRGPVEINPRDLMTRNADLRGVMLFATPPPVVEAAHHAIHEGLAKGLLRPVVARTFPLADAAQAHVAVLASGATGKIVLLP